MGLRGMEPMIARLPIQLRIVMSISSLAADVFFLLRIGVESIGRSRKVSFYEIKYLF